MVVVEHMAERAARGELSPTEVQASLAILLRDFLSREPSSGSVSTTQDDDPTREIGVER